MADVLQQEQLGIRQYFMLHVEKCVFGRAIKICADKNTTRSKPSPLDEQYNISLHQDENSIRTRIKRSCLPSEHLKHRFRELRRTIKRMFIERRLDYINSIYASRESNPERF